MTANQLLARDPKAAKKFARKRTLIRILSSWQLYALLLPGVIYVFIFSYMPMYGLQIAFKDFRGSLGIWGSPWVGLDHFIRFVKFPGFWQYIRNTAVISLYGILTFPIGVIFSLMLNELRSQKFKKTAQMITYAPHFISTVVVCGMVTLFFNESYGIVNNIMANLGLERVEFLTEAKYFRALYIWSGVWQNLGWSTIIYLAALSGVSTELVEAAVIDGASRFQIMRHINIPSIMPTITIMFIMNCGGILSVGFEKIFLLQNAMNLSVSQVISTYVYNVGLISAQYSYSSAIGLFNTVINVIVLIIVNLVVRRITEISLW